MSILEVRDVSIIYSDDKRVAVEHASFKIEAGEYACIIGSNGSGKIIIFSSTILIEKSFLSNLNGFTTEEDSTLLLIFVSLAFL